MGRVLTDAQMSAWLRRLSGGEPESGLRGTPGGSALPGWFTESVIRLDGHLGMLQLSNFGTMSAEDPAAFEAALLRRSIGSTVLFSTLETPHTVTYEPPPETDGDIVIVGFARHGGQRLRTAGGTRLMSVGRMGFMSSLGGSAVEHLGVSETTGVVVPASAVPDHRHVLARGAELFPDTPLTRAAGASLVRMLYEWSQDSDGDPRALAGTESMLLAVVRGLFRQFPGARGTDRTTEHRAAAARVIERRHRDADFDIDALAAELHMSRRQLFRLFAGTEESLASRILRRRLETARDELLTLPPLDLSAVATRSGFPDAPALRAQFGRHIGLSPSAFRLEALSHPPRLAEAMLLSDEQTRPEV
ncbi:AraC family transcriptional regulator [Microbacterium sp. 3J1]|uniref:AraC family transcriptional regulator n=1 Tax=Microbacterium sp. 3J1 TaxID=861269 RepID=UPI000AA3731A|nr:AraC family transcriptional regulator [Microbacterium sp. 3J1]